MKKVKKENERFNERIMVIIARFQIVAEWNNNKKRKQKKIDKESHQVEKE